MDKVDLCRKCKHRKFNMKIGTYCGLTGEKPDFDDNCPDFELDETVKLDETQEANVRVEEYKGGELKPNEKRAEAVTILIWIVLICEVGLLVAGTLRLNLFLKISHGYAISSGVALVSDLSRKIFAILRFFAYVISAIMFLMWFYRAYYNLHQRVEELSYKQGWAIASWLVPIVSLYMPYQIMKELYVETKKILLKKGIINEDGIFLNFLIPWWTLVIIQYIVSLVFNSIAKKAQTVDELITATVMSIILHIIGILISLVTIKVVKDYSKMETLLSEID